jgi:transposase
MKVVLAVGVDRGAAGKVPEFRFLRRGGKVDTKVIPDAKLETLLPIV